MLRLRRPPGEDPRMREAAPHDLKGLSPPQPPLRSCPSGSGQGGGAAPECRAASIGPLFCAASRWKTHPSGDDRPEQALWSAQAAPWSHRSGFLIGDLSSVERASWAGTWQGDGLEGGGGASRSAPQSNKGQARKLWDMKDPSNLKPGLLR